MIDTAPLDEALATLRSLLAWLHEPHAEAQLAGVIARLEAWGKDMRRADMEMIPVESSNVSSVGYNPETRELVVEFRGGAFYVYRDVAPENYAGLLKAPSKGSFLALVIKPQYAAARMPPPPQAPDTEEEQAALGEEREGISDALVEMGDESQDYYSLAEEPR